MANIRSAVARHPARTGLLVAAFLAVAGFGVYWFGPQYLFFDRRVEEAPPGVGAAAERETTDRAAEEGAVPPSEEVTILAEGEFRSLAHEASGRALIVQVADGSLFLRFEDLNVSDGPDLKVYLATAPSTAEESAFGQEFIELGDLKGNIGSSNYEIPAGTDLTKYPSAVVWCKRFSVGFAVAPVEVSA